MHKRLLLFLTFFAFVLMESLAQDSFENDDFDTSFTYDDIPVLVVLEGYPSFYIDVIYANNDKLYINIQELFYALGISCKAGPKRNSFEGFIGEDGQKYLIDFTEKHARLGKKDFNLRKRILKENGSLYLLSDYFAEIFGLHLKFNYRALSLILNADFELPVIKKQRLEALRENMAKVSGEVMVDTTIGREYHMFKPGVMDWSIASYQNWDGKVNNRLGLGIGAEIFNGEANFAVDYNDQFELTNRQIDYHWRWVDNDKKLIKQAQLGRISNRTIAYINSPLVGAVIRNTPTTIRKAKGYHTISDYTEPDWTVELYINNVLSDFTTADASGLYTFKIPLVYGYTTLKLKFYGPMGEERSEERSINMPYTVMAKNDFEYSLSAGLVQDTVLSRFGKADFNYGVNNILTIGGGVEYLSSISSGNYIPYAQFTMQPIGKLTLFGEYAHGVRARGLLSYYFKSNALLEIDYTKYVKGQRATFFNAQEERKLKLSLPFRFIRGFSGYSRFEIVEMVYDAFSYYQTSAMLSAHIRKLSANSIFQFNWINQNTPFIATEFNFSYQLGKGFIIRPSVKYNITDNQMINYKVVLEKSIPRGNFSASYERNSLFNDDLFNFTFRYDLSFAKTSASVAHTKGKLYTSETAQGSLIFGSGNNYLHKSNNSGLGKGGISLYPFLDINQNGIFDDNEHQVKINSVRAMGGRVFITDKDSIIRITNFNSFTKCIVEFNDNDLENIAWRFAHKKFEITIDPNQFKRVDVPVQSIGEVSGMVYQQKSTASLKGLGRILVNIYSKETNELIYQTLSEYDGYVNYLGLEPGDYIARIDSTQLNNIGFVSNILQVDFSIKPSEYGDIVDGLDFILSPKIDPMEFADQEIEELLVDTSDRLIDSVRTVRYLISDSTYKIQLLALSAPLTNKTYFAKLLKDIPGLVIEEMLGEDSLYHYSTRMSFKSKEEARNFQSRIKESGWEDSFVADYVKNLSADSSYKVQFLALSKPIKDKNYFAKLVDAIPGLIIEEKLGEDGLYHYSTTVSFEDINEARAFNQKIKNIGWGDSFVAEYIGEMRAEKAFRLKLAKQGKKLNISQPEVRISSKSNKSDDLIVIDELPVAISDTLIHDENVTTIDSASAGLNPEEKIVLDKVEQPNVSDSIIEDEMPIETNLDPFAEQKILVLDLKADVKSNQLEKIMIVRDTLSLLPNDVLFKVHLLALRVPIRVKGYFTRLKTDIPGLTVEETLGENGMYQYTTGAIKGEEQARELLHLIKLSGWNTCFLVTYTVVESEEPVYRLKRNK